MGCLGAARVRTSVVKVPVAPVVDVELVLCI